MKKRHNKLEKVQMSDVKKKWLK